MTVEDVKLGRRFKIKASLFRASGERLLICRLISENDTSLKDDITTQNLLSLYNLGTDGIVFTSANGFIEAANEGFLDLINTANLGDIKGRSLSEFLARGQIDLAVMLENVTRSGQVRVYATKLQNAVGSKLGVEVSVVRLPSDARETMAFVIRDTNRFEESPAPAITSEDFSQSNVAELVGSSTLREIVGETTDMIEKICIETAIELTQNNRAAAAEMLGLSRQSLYIKLRKFDLLARDRPS
jgi:transcriptional regulator PpsR